MYNIYHLIVVAIIFSGLGKFFSFLTCRYVAKKKGIDLGFWEAVFWWKK